MTVLFESGYTLPSGDELLTKARIAHNRNRCIGEVTALQTATGFIEGAPENGLTYEKWQGRDFYSLAELDSWTVSNTTIASVGSKVPRLRAGLPVAKLLETAVNNTHAITDSSFTESVGTNRQYFTIYVHSIGGRNCRLSYEDPLAAVYSADFDLSAGTVSGTSSASGIIRELGNNWWVITLSCTPTTGGTGGEFSVSTLDGTTSSFLGDVTKGLLLSWPNAAPGVSTWEYYFYGDQEVDYVVLGGHNMGYFCGTLNIQKSDGMGGWVNIISAQGTIEDNSAIYCIFEPVTVDAIRVRMVNMNPYVSTIWTGKSLQMPRPIFGGHVPSSFSRITEFRTNESESGEFLGRTRIRQYRGENFQWNHIENTWMADNWPDLQIASEEDPMFIAWRPDAYGDVSFMNVAASAIPENMGIRKLMTVGLEGKGLGHD